MYGPFKGKISTKTVPLKDLMADLLDKDFKTMVLKMLKELNENVEKVTKVIYEENGNNKETENQMRKKKQ